MKAIILLSLMSCCVYAADDFEIIRDNQPVLEDISKNILSLPRGTISTVFLKYLIYQSQLRVFEGTLDDIIAQLTEKHRSQEACLATFFAIHFDWQLVLKTMFQKNIDVEIPLEESEKAMAYLYQHHLVLQSIYQKIKVLPESKMLNLWLGLLIFEYESGLLYEQNRSGSFSQSILDWFKKNFPQGFYNCSKCIATLFNFSTMERLLNTVSSDVPTATSSENEKRLLKEKYFALWKANKGDVDVIQGGYFPQDGISCGDMVAYAKRIGCLRYFMLCSNAKKNYTIDLSNQHIDSLDGVDIIPTPEQCEDFSCDYNAIIAVPSFDKFIGLTKLSLSHNYLVHFPVALKSLRNLDRLQLNNNQIQDFPSDIQGFEALEELYLAHNRIEKFPICVAGFKKLKELDMQYNQISTVPACVKGLETVTKLYLSGNKIKLCPFLIKGMERLKVFKIA